MPYSVSELFLKPQPNTGKISGFVTFILNFLKTLDAKHFFNVKQAPTLLTLWKT